nr:RNA-directed DNA polymerase, eukaryota, reverse transcriptase zinc-binding domain protein [Tanacetum cinerariifolium]
MEEIKTVVWDCGSNKASGPDGYSFLFIKIFWDLLKHDIQEFVVSFFSLGKFPQGVNSAFITLIPKVSNPLFIKDYRPISLIGLHYKIVAKILYNRLSKVIDSITSPKQSTFISSRQILDGPPILSEIIDCEVVSMAACTGCEAGSFPFSYLGLPIGSSMNRIANWQILIDRFKARLLGWKANLLSIGGRLTLIKSVLGSLGIDLGGCKTSRTWAKIVGAINHLHSSGIVPLNSIRFKVGDGSKLMNTLSLLYFHAPGDIDSISCLVCNGHVESNDHIFFTCDTAVAI